jgi:hypothetical protein
MKVDDANHANCVIHDAEEQAVRKARENHAPQILVHYRKGSRPFEREVKCFNEGGSETAPQSDAMFSYQSYVFRKSRRVWRESLTFRLGGN